MLISFNSDKAILKNIAMLVTFAPRIDQMKDAIVGPNSRLDFLVNSYPLWWTFSGLIRLSSLMEFTVLGQTAGRESFWLVRSLWIRMVWSPRLVVTFVDKRRSLIFKSIPDTERCDELTLE